MGMSISFLLIAAGALLRWAVTAESELINLQTAGLILFIVGIAGAIASMIFWSSWGGFGRGVTTTTTDRLP